MPERTSTNPQPEKWPPPRPPIIVSTLEWCARMYLMEHGAAAPGDQFLDQAAAAFDRMVAEARETESG